MLATCTTLLLQAKYTRAKPAQLFQVYPNVIMDAIIRLHLYSRRRALVVAILIALLPIVNPVICLTRKMNLGVTITLKLNLMVMVVIRFKRAHLVTTTT